MSHSGLSASRGSFVAEDGGSWEARPCSRSHAPAVQRALPARSHALGSRGVCCQGVRHPPSQAAIPRGPRRIDMSRRAKPLGNHLFLFCCPSVWEGDWQLKGEGPEPVLIVWGPCSNMAGERGGPRRQGKNGNLCEAWHSKCHLCEDLDLLRSVFNNLGCSGLFLFPLCPKAPLPPLFLLHQQALFQSGLNALSVA